MGRLSSFAVLRANSHILETMAAQLETLADRTDAQEAQQLIKLATQTRMVAREYRRYAEFERADPTAVISTSTQH
jgi:hypothetical protein